MGIVAFSWLFWWLFCIPGDATFMMTLSDHCSSLSGTFCDLVEHGVWRYERWTWVWVLVSARGTCIRPGALSRFVSFVAIHFRLHVSFYSRVIFHFYVTVMYHYSSMLVLHYDTMNDTYIVRYHYLRHWCLWVFKLVMPVLRCRLIGIWYDILTFLLFHLFSWSMSR